MMTHKDKIWYIIENDGAVKEKEEVGRLLDKLSGFKPRDASQVEINVKHFLN